MTLAAETVKRRLPDLLSPDDARLFSAEEEKHFPAVETRTVSGDFLPSGWHRDSVGWKAALKNLLVRTTTRRQTFIPSQRTPMIATDRFSNGYFHWVSETLPRLWWLKDQLASYELILPSFAERFSYMRESLALFPDLAIRTIGSGT